MGLFIKKNGALVQVGTGTKVEKLEGTETVALDMSDGDQVITPSGQAQVLTQVTVQKPDTMVAGNIKKDIVIGGVTGSYEAVDLLANRISNLGDYSYTNNTITSIKIDAFYKDSNLSSITCNNVIEIGSSAFSYCNNLQNVSFNSLTTIGSSAFNYSNVASLNLPASKIESSAFSSCSNLITLTLPNFNTTSAYTGSYLCSNCNNLVTVSLDNWTGSTNGYTNGSYMFSLCSSLTNVSLPKAIIITSYMFNQCSSLQSISFPVVAQIGSSAFRDCTSLTDITLSKTSVCSLSNANAFTGIGHAVTIHVPSNLISSYQTASNWTTLYNNGDVTFVAIS